MRLVGKPTASSAGAAESAEFEGNRELKHPEALKNERFGVTRKSVAGKAGRCRNRGDLEPVSAGATGRARQRGNPRLTQRRR
jgi:hypothetical protein